MLPLEMINSDSHPGALTEIYQENVSMAVWQRQLDKHVVNYAQTLTKLTHCFQIRKAQSPGLVAEQLQKELPLNNYRQAFIHDVALIIDMFSCLFELNAVGLRLAVLNTAMCPKFHVDRVPCRLICTYTGAATQWHAHEHVERKEDGSLVLLPGVIPHSLQTGDVALLKGEAWEGNEGRGLVHRSPNATESARRLLLTVDFA